VPRNKMTDLRNHLFEVLEGLKDKEEPMDIDRAKAVCHVSEQIINSAKAEIDLLKACGASRPGDTQFFGMEEESRELPQIPERPRRINGHADPR
jgi:hypothetical protein